MIFQLSTIKFCPPDHRQETNDTTYQLYLQRDLQEEDMSLLQWLCNHSTANNRGRTLADDKLCMAVRSVSIFNPVFFHQNLVVHHPYCHGHLLRHLDTATMRLNIRHFAQAVLLCPDKWTTPEQIRCQFNYEGHQSSFLTTIVAYVLALHDILHLWHLQVVELYPL